MLAALLIAAALPAQLDAAKAAEYRAAVQACLDNLLEHGTDRYGPVHTPMFMSVIDVDTNEAPQFPLALDGLVRAEGRQHRRNPAGADLWEDQPLLDAMYAFSKSSGDPKYAAACDAYIAAFFERSRREATGLPAWGTHIYYDAYTDAPGGDQDGQGPHELLIQCPDWEPLWRVAPGPVQAAIEGMWEWHMVDPAIGLFNRHDDKALGCDFAFKGGTLIQAFAFLYTKTGDPKHLEWAKTVANRHWNARNPETNLAPDAPSTGDRYDATHCFTTITGPHAMALLKTYELTKDDFFRDIALAYIDAYLKYGWDPEARQWRAMLALDGTPVMDQEKGPGYDAYKPTGYVDMWPVIMFSYEFPLIAAQTAAYAAELTGDPAARESADHWAETIRANLPPNAGRRWRQELFQAMPAAIQSGGTYAENYGRAIDFFRRRHALTNDTADLQTAVQLAGEALAELQHNGWLKGHPAKPYYETTDGVGVLLKALLDLAEYEAKTVGPETSEFRQTIP